MTCADETGHLDTLEPGDTVNFDLPPDSDVDLELPVHVIQYDGEDAVPILVQSSKWCDACEVTHVVAVIQAWN